MSSSYFDRNQNLQIHGDVNFISNSGASQDNRNFFHVAQQVQATNTQYRALDRGFKILGDNTAPSARYGYGHSFTGPQCHPGTRTAVQDHIFEWFDDPGSQITMWMNGPVGIGKSAIAQTVAHLAAERGQLASAFFFFRSDDTRNSAEHLVATLAYEMTQQMPFTLDSVCLTIAADPLIFTSPLEHQINDILLQHLYCPDRSLMQVPKLIIIDGLDECLDNTAQQTIIRSFISSLLSASTSIIQHKLLLVSRPESHIKSALSALTISSHVKHLSLDSWSTWDDIGKFLRDKLKEIKDTHPIKRHLPVIWPDEDSFRRLRERSVGSFAYASAVIRFLASHNHNPKRALQDILSIQPHRATAAFAEMDALYRHIFSSLDPDIRFTAQRALCLYLYSADGNIAHLATGLSEEQPVVELALIHISSLIHFDGQYISLHHSSFGEFLRDKERSRELHVFSSDVVSAVATTLSNLWLHPTYDCNCSCWFSTMGKRIMETEDNMNVQILSTLAATNLSATIFTLEQCHRTAATSFFQAIQWRSMTSSYSPHGSVYSEAFDVVCAGLRQQLDILFRGVASLSDILDIILGYSPNFSKIAGQGGLAVYVFFDLATNNRNSLDFLCRLFPDMDCSEIYCGIVEKYLTLPSRSRQLDTSRWYLNPKPPLTVTELYQTVLGREDTMTTNFCKRLEELVFGGLKDFGISSTSKNCIFRSLCGRTCKIDYWGHLRIMRRDDNYFDKEGMWGEIVETTDRYIRQVHAKLDFPFISEDVEALYDLPPKELKVWVLPYTDELSDSEDFGIEWEEDGESE